MPIGNGIAVSAIQMLDVYLTLANGGLARAPRLVKATVDQNGERHDVPLLPTHRVVSPETASAVTGMLELVVEGGTGQEAAVTGLPGGGQDRNRPQASVRAPALPLRRVVRRICARERPADRVHRRARRAHAAPSSAASSRRPRSPRSCSRRWARSASRRPREAGGRGGGPADPPGSRTRSRRGRPVP